MLKDIYLRGFPDFCIGASSKLLERLGGHEALISCNVQCVGLRGGLFIYFNN